MGRQYPLGPVPAVAAVVLKKEVADDHYSVLLVKRANPPSQGEWSLPGGVVELGETLHAGIVREVEEETGIRVEPVLLLEVFDHIVRDGTTDGHVDGRIRFHYVLIDYLCRFLGGELAGRSDALEARWATREQLEDRDIAHALGFPLPARTLQVIHKAFRALDDGSAQI